MSSPRPPRGSSGLRCLVRRDSHVFLFFFHAPGGQEGDVPAATEEERKKEEEEEEDGQKVESGGESGEGWGGSARGGVRSAVLAVAGRTERPHTALGPGPR